MTTPTDSEDEDTKVIARNPYDLPEIPQDRQTKAYWIGTLPTCPRWVVHVAGVAFHRFTDPPVETDKDSGVTQRAYGRGQVLHLTEGKAQAVKEGLKNKVVRFIGPSKGILLNRDGRNYMQHPADEPLAMHVYMIEANERSFIQREDSRGGYPDSVYKMAGGKSKSKASQYASSGPRPEVGPGIDDMEDEKSYQTQLKNK